MSRIHVPQRSHLLAPARTILASFRRTRWWAARALFSLARKHRIKRRHQDTVLFVSHRERQCGIHEFGRNIAAALGPSSAFRFRYVECSSGSELLRTVLWHRPAAIVYNHNPATMPWLTQEVATQVRRLTNYAIRQIAIIHECPQDIVDTVTAETFDYHIAPDPTLDRRNPIVFTTGRLVPTYQNRSRPPEVVTVGSLGFGFAQKRYDLVIQAVQKEFDQAVVRINIAFNGVADTDGAQAREAADRCKRIPAKPGIKVEITHKFLDPADLLDFLAQNTINAFFYDWQEGRGISAVVESALAVDRPLAVNRTPMFRHVWDIQPSICIEDTTLKEIIRNGTAPLRDIRNRWTSEAIRGEYEGIVRDSLNGKCLYEIALKSTPAVTLNRILDDEARLLYGPAVRKLWLLSPDVMKRKIPEANVQQGFVLDTVQVLAARHGFRPLILCVGCHEDSAYTSLQRLGYGVIGIDPVVNCDLETFVRTNPRRLGTFDIVFSTSVLEHVPEDERFVGRIAELLRPGGYAVVTCDYNDSYRVGDRIPSVDQRLYTQHDLFSRIVPAMAKCTLVDTPEWDCPSPDFTFDGCQYTFATLTVQKRP